MKEAAKDEDELEEVDTTSEPILIEEKEDQDKPSDDSVSNDDEVDNSQARKTKIPWFEIKVLGVVLLGICFFTFYNKEDDEPVSIPDERIIFGPDSIHSVYDGDTFRVNLPNLPPVFSEAIPIRLAGIDAAEMADTEGEVLEYAQKAQAFTENALMNAEKIELRNMQRGKYFRIVADVFVDGESLSGLLLKEEIVKEYNGTGPRSPW